MVAPAVQGQLVYEPDIARIHRSRFRKRLSERRTCSLQLVIAPLLWVESFCGLRAVPGSTSAAHRRMRAFSSGESASSCARADGTTSLRAVSRAPGSSCTRALQQAYDDLRTREQQIMQRGVRLRALGQMASAVSRTTSTPQISPVAALHRGAASLERGAKPDRIAGASQPEAIQRAVDDIAQTVARMPVSVRSPARAPAQR